MTQVGSTRQSIRDKQPAIFILLNFTDQPNFFRGNCTARRCDESASAAHSLLPRHMLAQPAKDSDREGTAPSESRQPARTPSKTLAVRLRLHGWTICSATMPGIAIRSGSRSLY